MLVVVKRRSVYKEGGAHIPQYERSRGRRTAPAPGARNPQPPGRGWAGLWKAHLLITGILTDTLKATASTCKSGAMTSRTHRGHTQMGVMGVGAPCCSLSAARGLLCLFKTTSVHGEKLMRGKGLAPPPSATPRQRLGGSLVKRLFPKVRLPSIQPLPHFHTSPQTRWTCSC